MDSMAERLDLTPYSPAPRYNIRAVEKSTGLSARTLRSWERRYGVPAPERDGQGRRLYSDRDIALIRWLMARVEQGMAVGRATALLSGEDERAGDVSLPPLDTLQLRLLQAIDWLDEADVMRVLTQALRALPEENVVLDLMQPVLYRMGDLWEAGRMSVASEHFGTHLIRTALADLFARGPAPSRTERILVGCPPGELHDFGALAFALFLRRAGFPVTFIGASLDAASLTDDLRRILPAALCLSATTDHAAAALAALYAGLAGSFQGVLAYGGSAFDGPEAPADVPGVFLGRDIRMAVERLRALLQARPPDSVQP
ncbi:MAG TPA: MerR family transcriptional regulator [Chloroflexota bacterium]|nr:MerR family transcriptional regulator [Chloroflexota bacterium]